MGLRGCSLPDQRRQLARLQALLRRHAERHLHLPARQRGPRLAPRLPEGRGHDAGVWLAQQGRRPLLARLGLRPPPHDPRRGRPGRRREPPCDRLRRPQKPWGDVLHEWLAADVVPDRAVPAHRILHRLPRERGTGPFSRGGRPCRWRQQWDRRRRPDAASACRSAELVLQIADERGSCFLPRAHAVVRLGHGRRVHAARRAGVESLALRPLGGADEGHSDGWGHQKALRGRDGELHRVLRH
mmetsp:Transcript_63599/g.165160  ORF Transcript_63599/g.165160 Transcript_63599/m.165160 type:complete len:242 (+) Transcript_63599:241-966(+)